MSARANTHALPRRPTVILMVLLLLPAVGTTTASDAPAPLPLVAVIDTGIMPNHPEFGANQIVAWWSFTSEGKPAGVSNNPADYLAPSRSWDPHVEPFDLNGHGTATASLAAGLNTGTCTGHAKTSLAPGAKLIIAKVSTQDADDPLGGSTIDGDIGLAIKWAVDMGADVISMSIGSIAPVPIHSEKAALTYARAHGVLVVVAAGNGAANLGLAPTPTWGSFYGNSLDVLSVGSGLHGSETRTTLTGNLDPDVTSWGDNVCVASLTGGYKRGSGTSYAAPLVAGMAATARAEARAHGQPHNADRIERLLILGGTNTVASPYAREGNGFLFEPEMPGILAHARAGTLPGEMERGNHAYADLIYHDIVLKRAKTGAFI